MMMTELLYDTMQADNYWKGEAAPDIQPLPWAANRYDRAMARRSLGKITRIFGELKTQGVEARQLELGQELQLDAPDGLLRVVEDVRLISKRDRIVGDREFVEPKLFNKRTQAMMDDLLFAGAAVKAKFAPKDGNPMDFARRVGYFTHAASGLQLIGLMGQTIGNRMTGYAAGFKPYQIPVGSITSYETSTDIAEVKLTSALVLRPTK